MPFLKGVILVHEEGRVYSKHFEQSLVSLRVAHTMSSLAAVVSGKQLASIAQVE